MGEEGEEKAEKKEQEEIDPNSPEYQENLQRWKIARNLAIFIVVFGSIYFFISRVFFPKDSEAGLDPIEVEFLTRECFSTEDTCDEPCGRKVQTPGGKYCCLKGTCTTVGPEVRDCRITEVTCPNPCGRGIVTPGGDYCCLGSC